MESTLGFSHFLAQADAVARMILLIMLAMSVTTWYLIFTKSIRNLFTSQKSRAFLRMFWEAPNVSVIAARLQEQEKRGEPLQEPFSELVQQGLVAAEQHRTRGVQRLIEAGTGDDFLTRSLRRSIEQTTARAESGLTALASVGSSAPFVGLFGTVWGIYHALLAIGMSGQGTLDKVAGPVGEALIMTAIGLAVAIPAVLAYNTFTRHNRIMLVELDSFAHDVFTFMSTGHRMDDATRAAERKAVPHALAVAAAPVMKAV